MFRRKQRRNAPQPVVRQQANAESSGRSGAVGRPFRLGVDLYDLVTNDATGWQVMHDPRTTTVTLYRPNSGHVELDVGRAATDVWIGLEEADGSRMPLEIYKDRRSGALLGRWVEVLGGYAAGAGDPVSDDERRRAYQDASSQQANAHSTAMGIIYNIR